MELAPLPEIMFILQAGENNSNKNFKAEPMR